MGRMNSPMNVGLVGYGLAGRVFHAPLIHANPNMRLTRIVQRTGDEAAARYPEAKILRDAQPLLDDREVELVVVATPNDSHFELASRAMQAGKHVVVDKPFTITTRDADELIAIAKKTRRVLSVFQNRRWDGDFLTVQKILREKGVGELAEFESRFDRFRPALKPGAWREKAEPGAGVFYDLGPHLIDQSLMLFGKPQGVYAEMRRQREGAEVDDSFQVHLQYPRVKVLLKAGALVCEPSPRFVLYGTEGSYVKYGLDPQEEALKQGGSPTQANWGADPEPEWGTLARCDGEVQRKKYPTLPGCYQNYYENVYRAIRGTEELVVTASQGRDVIRIIELAQESANQKRLVAVD
jgi:scyllo-inositol 2-dehydrogenase (NADP+)